MRHRHQKQQRNGGDITALNTVLAINNNTQAGEQDAAVLITELYLTLDKLLAGGLDATGFVALNEGNCAAFCLGAELFKHSANPETAELIAQTQPIFEAAAEALADIGERFIRRGHYGATGTEAQAIRASIAQYDALIRVADRSHITRAILAAEKMVNETLLRKAA
jgi:uncharacterized SAM-binding protein YcdF (DUF218 family)